MKVVRRPKGFQKNRNRTIAQQVGQPERRLARFLSSSRFGRRPVTLDVRQYKPIKSFAILELMMATKQQVLDKIGDALVSLASKVQQATNPPDVALAQKWASVLMECSHAYGSVQGNVLPLAAFNLPTNSSTDDESKSSVDPIELNITVCETRESIVIGGAEYRGGFRGKLGPGMVRVLDGDIAAVTIPELKLDARISSAADIAFLSLRVCKDSSSLIPFYRTGDKNRWGCCGLSHVLWAREKERTMTREEPEGCRVKRRVARVGRLRPSSSGRPWN